MLIAVVHHPKNNLQLKNLLPTLKNLPVKVYTNSDPSEYELGVLRRAMNDTDEDIFLLQDSCEIKNIEIFAIAEAHKGGMALNPTFQMYLGKYDRTILDRLVIPIPISKAEAVHYEDTFNSQYIKADTNFTVFHQPLTDTTVFEEKFGHTNMILENDFIKKYKRCWSTTQITEFM